MLWTGAEVKGNMALGRWVDDDTCTFNLWPEDFRLFPCITIGCLFVQLCDLAVTA